MGGGPETRQPRIREALYTVIYYVYAGDVSLPIIAGDSVVNSIVHHFECVHIYGYSHYILKLQLVFLEFEYHYTSYLIYVSFTARSCLHCEITVQCLIYCMLITWGIQAYWAWTHPEHKLYSTYCNWTKLTVVLLVVSTAQLYIGS